MLLCVRNAEQDKQKGGREKLDFPGKKERMQREGEWVHLAQRKVCVRDQAWHDEIGFFWKGKGWRCRNWESGFGEIAEGNSCPATEGKRWQSRASWGWPTLQACPRPA